MVKPVGKQRYVETSPMTTKRLRFLVRLPGETFHRTWKVPSAKTGKAFVSSFRGVVGFDLIFPLIFSREFQTYTQEDALDLTESFGSIPRFARWWTIQEGSWECKEIRVSWGKFRLMKYYHAGKMRYDLWWHLLDDKICSKVLTIEYGKHISGKNSIFVHLEPQTNTFMFARVTKLLKLLFQGMSVFTYHFFPEKDLPWFTWCAIP